MQTFPHYYIEVGRRRWCLGCNTFQTWRAGAWRDRADMIGPWPAYERTQADCPRDTQWARDQDA